MKLLVSIWIIFVNCVRSACRVSRSCTCSTRDSHRVVCACREILRKRLIAIPTPPVQRSSHQNPLVQGAISMHMQAPTVRLYLNGVAITLWVLNSTQNACRSPAGRSPDQQSASLRHNSVLEQTWSLPASVVHCADKFGQSVALDYSDYIGSQGTVMVSMAKKRNN